MSTKSSIKWRDVSEESIGFHLYDDVMDSFCAAEDDPEPPVYLRLDGVEVELSAILGGGVSVTVAIPREAARELGLLPPALGVKGPDHA